MTDVPRRVLVVGLDGASFALLAPWAAAGELPEIAALMAAGSHAEIRSTFPVLTPPAWSTFVTGKNPGKHGVYSFRELAWRGYASGDLVTADHLRARTLWDVAGEAGLVVGAVNVPPAYPVRPVNGFMVACLLAPPGAREIAWPPEIRDVLGDDYEIATEPPRGLGRDAPDYRTRCLEYLDHLRRLAERRLAVTMRLARERPWDLLGVVFYEPDRIQHFFWDYLLGAVPGDVEPGVAAEIAAAARPIYHLLDAAIGELVRIAGPDAATILVSDHGFGPAPTRVVRVNHWLARGGHLRTRRGWRWRRRVLRRLPSRFRRRWDTVEQVVDWSTTRAWCEVIEVRSAGVWLNVRGRQPLGCVAPGAEYDALREALVRDLAALREDGGPVFELVAPREDVYHGPWTERAPDVVLQTAPRYGLRFNSLRAEVRARGDFGEFADAVWPFTGSHDPAGIFVAAGAGIAPGGRVEPLPLEALAPTILALLGVPVPDGMDAPPREDLFTSALRAARPVRRQPDRDPDPPAGDGVLSADEREAVEVRLRALGYVE
jgi:predicted AlkP superfamily phosphohydrolase/phosphomutase